MILNLENLFGLINKRGEIKKLAKATGISTGNISDWKAGRSKPGADALCKIADVFNCSVDYLLGRTEIKEVNHKSNILPVTVYRLPVYEQDVAAGSGQLGFDQKHSIDEFEISNIPKNVSYGINIRGNSMETNDKNNIPDGCTVFVTTNFDYSDLEGKAVVVNIGGKLVCKEYNIAEDGHLWLKSRNTKKSKEDRHIYNIDNIKIIGMISGIVEDNKFVSIK